MNSNALLPPPASRSGTNGTRSSEAHAAASGRGGNLLLAGALGGASRNALTPPAAAPIVVPTRLPAPSQEGDWAAKIGRHVQGMKLSPEDRAKEHERSLYMAAAIGKLLEQPDGPSRKDIHAAIGDGVKAGHFSPDDVATLVKNLPSDPAKLRGALADARKVHIVAAIHLAQPAPADAKGG